MEDLYQYTPAYALAFVPFLSMSPAAVSVLHTLIHIVAFVCLYLAWDSVFEESGMNRARQVQALTLPLWLVFSPFWSDLGYLNIYIIMALLSTLLIRAILRQQMARSVLWLSLILQTKPQWAFAAAVPLLLGRWRFFLRMVGWSILAYACIMAGTMARAGPAYTGEQYLAYVRSLWTLPARFPWRGPEAPFLGYNHSIKQIIIYSMGESETMLTLASWVKVVLLLPLALVARRHLCLKVRGNLVASAEREVGLAFLLYLGAFIWLDMVWELSLGIALFAYLLATADQAWMRWAAWTVFAPYALIDLWQLISFAVFGMDAVAPGPYVLTDPSIYVPVVMIVILTFYTLLIIHVWRSTPSRSTVRRITGL